MKHMLKLTILISLILFSMGQDIAGVKIAVRQEAIAGFERQFLPLLVDQLGNISIPDTQIDLDAGISTLHIYLTSVHFSFNNLQADKIQVGFIVPDKVSINAQEIHGSGHLNIKFKLGFLSETDSVDVRINKLGFIAQATLTTQESAQVKGKLMPSGYLSDLQINLDFDFDIHGSIVAFIAGLVKSKIKEYINSQINSQLRNVIIDESKNLIAELVNQIPVYVPLEDSGLALDYSLLSAPKVVEGYLVVNSNGAIVNLNHPESLNPPFSPSEHLPDFDPNGKQIQLFLSEYSINTALNTVFLSNMLTVLLKSENVPADSPIQLTTTYLETVIPGISDVYGKDKKVDVESKVVKRPECKVQKDDISGNVSAELALFVRQDDGTSDEAIRIRTTIFASGDAHVESEGNIFVQVHKIQISDSTIIQTKVKDANVENIEVVFNFSTKILIPILNDKYLKNINITLPSIEGISFEDSTVQIPKNYVEMNVNPHFSPQDFINGYIQRRFAKNNPELQESSMTLNEEVASLFLNWG